MTERMTLQSALQAVRASDDGLYGVLLENGSMELGYYRPSYSDDFGAWVIFYGPTGGEA